MLNYRCCLDAEQGKKGERNQNGPILLFSFLAGLRLGFRVLSALRYEIEQRKSGYQGTRAWRAGEQAIRQGRPVPATSILRRSELLMWVPGNTRDILSANALFLCVLPSRITSARPFGPDGDGVVDVKDLAILAECWLKEARLPSGLVAYWKLDETEGDIARDSAEGHHAALQGGPVWQARGGKIRGALQFDGIDDYVSAPFVLDPSAAGGFSVFAWVKGGGPEQAIISQAGGVNWLCASAEGKLMTELKASGRFGTPLFSQTVIIDGEWHRVGLTWDGSTRTLFVDDVEVAKGTQASLASSQGGLQIGAGKNLEAGSFWSGLIDDVRIHSASLRTGSTTG